MNRGKAPAPLETLAWRDGKLRIIDQTRLPRELAIMEIADYRHVIAAIRNLEVRGAPAIGIAAAYGAVLAAEEAVGSPSPEVRSRLRKALSELRLARPTAVDLMWAIDRVGEVVDRTDVPDEGLAEAILEVARRIHCEDLDKSLRMGELGASLLPDEATVLTHCNAGGLATGGYGTALAVVFAAWEAGKKIRVVADETRPLLQGARLTAWELQRAGIPVTLVCDAAAPWLIGSGEIDAVLVGSDRIAANGDVANKIGTLGIALAADASGIPFYVVAPTSTLDPDTLSGEEIPIEERDAEEVTRIFGIRTAPEGIDVRNPAFDVTPARYVTAIITERGIHRPPYQESLR
ncbi:MAG: S-methyl-5-thioribose-1-phosphate isomerase [Candidatus Eisenbacteria sp.]|nr:S-methyl-5-thioribose-1-phosphate isomerase [Candidatus Eisenbacteria bacterium]